MGTKTVLTGLTHSTFGRTTRLLGYSPYRGAKLGVCKALREVRCYLASLFPENINLFWQDEFMVETLDVVQDTDWIIFVGNVFAKQYEFYNSDDKYSALLNRITTLEFDDDRKSMGVIMLSNSEKKWLLVKVIHLAAARIQVMAEPRHALEIVMLLKDVGIVFAVTGDGVNAREEAQDRELPTEIIPTDFRRKHYQQNSDTYSVAVSDRIPADAN
ncbi:hypothetical protein Tco_0668245 [Tanacetum coccineum]